MTLSHMGFYDPNACQLSEFQELTQQTLDPKDVPLAASIEKSVPVYDGANVAQQLKGARQRVLSEWAWVLGQGPGVLVITGAQSNLDAIDQATEVYGQIIAAEKEALGGGADHFAAAGSNDRIWNSLQKLCLTAPDVFVAYFASPLMDAACEAWLGPNYQMTAQVNLVHPGGQAQQAHRDYHLGFQTAEVSATYPAHVHDLSPLMTLQGGLAHCDIPIDSGPTKLLPYSQLYRPGYAAWRRQDFRDDFEDRYIQLPLEKGDALFFNPALFHAAGENRSADIQRMVNLLQISSAFGRAMETVDRPAMCLAAYDSLRAAWNEKTLSEAQLDATLAATAEGYSFPTNLDNDPPVGGLAPQTQQALLKEAISEGWSKEAFTRALQAQSARQKA
ncbi:phytanoyl-CoA dioxygenase family protein [Cognatishimia sp.]|uniref:phytanoyl-CoA dioxygenase family protein n=1 Tax=Cognatishimia sp. TaxID=2211648 RepID=UPI0035114EFA